ncbi:hypothetical protein MNBD_GAMMA08-980 [hydrothermal vent metagenome]|uniref:Uncharacterized protein n=1 Tax=hydrothermal vent metagenome TaxID=652676 RepID=A0A3B0XF55_9ZZZZ
MNKYIHKFLLHSIAFIFLLLSNSLYAGEPSSTSKLTKTDYHKLCNIYKEITNKYNNKSVHENIKEGELIDAIHDNLPYLYSDIYIHAIKVAAKDRYNFLKDYAKQNNKITWECEAAELYYINTYKKIYQHLQKNK